MTRQLPDWWAGYCPVCAKRMMMEAGRHQCDNCGARFSLHDWLGRESIVDDATIRNPLQNWEDGELKGRFQEQCEKITELGREGANDLVVFYALAWELSLRGFDPFEVLV